MESNSKIALYGKTLSQLAEITAELGMPRYAARQIAVWMYKKGAVSIDGMTDISVANRQRLSRKYEVGLSEPLKMSESTDGTRKYLFRYPDALIESAMIPDRERKTLCVSTQAGCRMGCRFCMTARQGLSRNLSSNEILNQMRSVPEHAALTNLVYMGMGEPMDNLEPVLDSLQILTSDWGYGWSPSRITVSTVGITPAVKEFLERTSVHLAVSLHNPFADQRLTLMPVEKAYPVYDLVETLKSYDFSGQRRVSFEYIVMRGQNDSPEHVRELARMLNGIKCRINLIRLHEIPDSEYASPDADAMLRFRDALNKKGIITTIRASRGEDIEAACGLLSTLDK